MPLSVTVATAEGLWLSAERTDLFPGSLPPLPSFLSVLPLGIKQLTFLLFSLMPFMHLSLYANSVGTGPVSFDATAERQGQGGIWLQLGLFGSLIPKLRYEGLQVSLEANCRWSADLLGFTSKSSKVDSADCYLLNGRKKARE